MDCPICLDLVLQHALLGRVHRCHHAYHEACLAQWAAHSNLCPTCRKPFHRIDVVVRSRPHQVLRTLHITDKLLEHGAIDDIPAEYVLLPHDYAPQPEPDAQGVCTVCSSAQIARANSMVGCVACGACFHTLCLAHGAWFCPVCDQELPVSARARTRPPRAASRRAPTTTRTTSRAGEDFDYTVRATLVVNGGVLLRREARALRNLSPDEAHAWSMFDAARATQPEPQEPQESQEPQAESRSEGLHSEQPSLNQQNIGEENGNGNGREDAPTGRKRRRRPRAAAAPPAAVPQSSPSRIATLMSQIKHPRSSPYTLGSPSSAESELDEKRPELTLEQKQQVQRHVRSQLRPWYSGEFRGAIKSEAEYVHINRSLSRQAYAAILLRSSPEVGELFADALQLETLVGECARSWIPRQADVDTDG